MHAVESFDVYLLACAVPAVWKGGGPERATAAALIAAALATKLSVGALAIGFTSPSVLLVGIDVALAAALFVIALRANRIWTMVVAAFQLCIVVAHAAKLVDPALSPLAYYLIMTKWSYLPPVLLVVAAIRHQQRLKRFGMDLSWSVWS